jgi:hypothetical protein
LGVINEHLPLYMPCPARVVFNRYLSLTHSHSLGLAGLDLARARHGRHYAEKLSLDRAAILEPTATICAPIPPRKGIAASGTAPDKLLYWDRGKIPDVEWEWSGWCSVGMPRFLPIFPPWTGQQATAASSKGD